MRSMLNRTAAGAGAAALLLIAAGPALGDVSFHDLGVGGASGISGDGSTVVGSMNGANVWSAAGGYRSLPLYQGHAVGATSVSYDGTVFAGKIGYWDQQQIWHQHAFRWSEQAGFDVVSIFGQSRGVSYDGSAVAWDNLPDQLPLGSVGGGRWTSSSNQSFGLGYWGQVYGISGDGSTVAASGLINVNTGQAIARRWTAAGGLEDLAPGFREAYAYGVNVDGKVIVGAARATDATPRPLPTKWTSATGTVMLPVPAGTGSGAARAVSADGSIAVGDLADAGTAAMWTPEGYLKLRDYLIAHGIDMTGWNLQSARGISADGMTMVGYGTLNGQSHAWVVTIPTPGAGLALGLMVVVGRRKKR